jgi:hypothetical protein
MKMNQFTIKKSFLVLLCINFLTTQSLFAKQIQLTEARNLRTIGEAPLSIVGRLAAGSVIDIPDEYAVAKKDGQFDFDASVEKWSHAMKDKEGASPILAKFNEQQKDYFIPIKIIQAAPGSRVKEAQDNLLISIRNVAIFKDGENIKMQTKESTPILKSKSLKNADCDEICQKWKESEKKDKAELKASQKKMEVSSPASGSTPQSCDGACSTDTGTIQQVVVQAKKLKKVVSPDDKTKLVGRNYAKSKMILSAQDQFDEMSKNLKETCHIEMKDFTKMIDQKVKGTPFMTEQFLAIMQRESKGICFPSGSNGVAEKHGLFGIQDADSTLSTEHVCTDKQKKALHQAVGKNSDALEIFRNYDSHPEINCVGNPVRNFEASLRILTGKLAISEKANSKLPRAMFEGEEKIRDSAMAKVFFNYNGNVKPAFTMVKGRKVKTGKSMRQAYSEAVTGTARNFKLLTDLMKETVSAATVADTQN